MQLVPYHEKYYHLFSGSIFPPNCSPNTFCHNCRMIKHSTGKIELQKITMFNAKKLTGYLQLWCCCRHLLGWLCILLDRNHKSINQIGGFVVFFTRFHLPVFAMMHHKIFDISTKYDWSTTLPQFIIPLFIVGNCLFFVSVCMFFFPLDNLIEFFFWGEFISIPSLPSPSFQSLFKKHHLYKMSP